MIENEFENEITEILQKIKAKLEQNGSLDREWWKFILLLFTLGNKFPKDEEEKQKLFKQLDNKLKEIEDITKQ